MAIIDTLIGNVRGKAGEAGEITSVTASVADNVGTPTCNVDLGGTPSKRTLHFAFSGLKGTDAFYAEAIIDIENKELELTNATQNDICVAIDNGKRVVIAAKTLASQAEQYGNVIYYFECQDKNIALNEYTFFNNNELGSWYFYLDKNSDSYTVDVNFNFFVSETEITTETWTFTLSDGTTVTKRVVLK